MFLESSQQFMEGFQEQEPFQKVSGVKAQGRASGCQRVQGVLRKYLGAMERCGRAPEG